MARPPMEQVRKPWYGALREHDIADKIFHGDPMDVPEPKPDRDVEFEEKYQATLDEKTAASSRLFTDELTLAKQQAAGRLGFALSSGPGTSGLSVAAQNALERQFATSRTMGLGKIREAAADFRLSWDLQEDKFDYGFEMAALQFKQQQALLQQQAELNSASWWEQLGGIIGFGLGLAMPGGASVAWGLGSSIFSGGGSSPYSGNAAVTGGY